MKRSQLSPKRLLSLLMAVAMLCPSMPFSIAAAEELNADQVAQQLAEIEAKEIAATTEPIELAEISVNRANDLVVETKDGRKFIFSDDPPDEKSAQEYAQFNDLEKAKFQNARAAMLARIVPILARRELTFGVGSLVWKGLKPIRMVVDGAVKGTKYILYNLTLRKNEKLNPFSELAKASLPDHLETPKNIRERGAMALSTTLKAIDKVLWQKSYELINHNQFVAKVSIAVAGQSGVFKYVIGGSKGLAFRFGYDSVTKRFIYDVIVETEKLDYALLCPLVVGPMIKIGFASYANTSEGRCIEAKAYYAPGLPLTVSRGRDFSEAAASLSIFAFPSVILTGKAAFDLAVPWLLAGAATTGEGFMYKSTATTRLPAQRKNPSAVEKISVATEALAYKIKERDRRERLQELKMSTDSECEIILSRTADD